MDILNFISWTKNGRTVSTVDASQTLLPVGLKDPKRDDGYLAGAISVADFASSLSPSVYDDEGNTFIGENVFNNISNPSKWANTAIGRNALKNTVAGQNIGIGEDTLYYNTIGFQNIAIGNNALNRNITGENNVAVGIVSMQYNTTGSNNIAIGTLTMLFNTTGSFNTSIGLSVASWSTTASSNTALGAQTDYGNFNSCVLLGRQAQSSGNNQFVVGSSSYSAGAVTTETVSSTRTWTVKINGVDRKILLA